MDIVVVHFCNNSVFIYSGMDLLSFPCWHKHYFMTDKLLLLVFQLKTWKQSLFLWQAASKKSLRLKLFFLLSCLLCVLYVDITLAHPFRLGAFFYIEMIHWSVLTGLTNKAKIPRKMLRYKDWTGEELKTSQFPNLYFFHVYVIYNYR